MGALLGLVIAIAAQLQPLPPNLVPLDSDEGRRLLSTASNRDFFALVGTIETQREPSFCGVASGVAVLNALPISAPEIIFGFRGYTEDNIFNDAAKQASLTAEHVARGGMTMDQLADLLRTNHADVEVRFAQQLTAEDFRREASAAVADSERYILIDFSRGDLGQDSGAHWSPIAAYDQTTDRFLVLDVARFRYRPYWATASDLYKAMATTDSDAGKSRGWLVVSAAKNAPARVTIPPVRHRIMMYAAAAGTTIFLLGALVGALVGRWRLRKKLAAQGSRA